MSRENILSAQSKKLFKLSQLIEKEIISIDDVAEIVPGIMHVNTRDDLALEFMSKAGCDIIRYSNEELRMLGAEVLQRHQSDYTLQVTYPRLFAKLAVGDKDKIIPFFQDWKYSPDEKPVFHFTTTKILNDTQLISISLFPQHIEAFSEHITKMFGMNKILDRYFVQYNNLTKREKEILALLGKELTRKQISDLLFISERTVKKHCENLYRKLGTNKRSNLEKIASVFSRI